jgi:hypothetical protein
LTTFTWRHRHGRQSLRELVGSARGVGRVVRSDLPWKADPAALRVGKLDSPERERMELLDEPGAARTVTETREIKGQAGQAPPYPRGIAVELSETGTAWLERLAGEKRHRPPPAVAVSVTSGEGWRQD